MTLGFLLFPFASTVPRALAFFATDQITFFLKAFPNPIQPHLEKMAEAASKWAESEMDSAKIKALVATEKIPKKEFVKWIEVDGQHWPSGEIDQIPVI